MLDRWRISIDDEERDKSEPVYKVTQSVPYNIINNYFSIGVVSKRYIDVSFLDVLDVLSAVRCHSKSLCLLTPCDIFHTLH